MQRILFGLLSVLSSLLLLISCEQDEDGDSKTVENVDATLFWTGEQALDGCGFILRFADEDYKPMNEEVIPESYKEARTTAVEATILNSMSSGRVDVASLETK